MNDMAEKNQSNVPKQVYTVEEISKILSVSKASAYRLVKEGVFSSVRIGNAIRVPKAGFDYWLLTSKSD